MTIFRATCPRALMLVGVLMLMAAASLDRLAATRHRDIE